MTEFALYGAAAVLAVLFRYLLNLSQACRIVGQTISEVKTTYTGLQDAITPPISTKLTMATWIAVLGLLGYAVYEFAWSTAGITLAVFFVVSILVGAVILPGTDSRHFLRLIYGSMVRRYADFEKEGDRVRGEAMKELIGRVEDRYADKLVGQA